MQNLIPSRSVKFQTPGPVCYWATSADSWDFYKRIVWLHNDLLLVNITVWKDTHPWIDYSLLNAMLLFNPGHGQNTSLQGHPKKCLYPGLLFDHDVNEDFRTKNCLRPGWSGLGDSPLATRTRNVLQIKHGKPHGARSISFRFRRLLVKHYGHCA